MGLNVSPNLKPPIPPHRPIELFVKPPAPIFPILGETPPERCSCSNLSRKSAPSVFGGSFPAEWDRRGILNALGWLSPCS